MYKSKLQEICQRRQWELPEYVMRREGPDHNPRFQATVVIDDVTFQSRATCRSMKQAQNEVAHVALRFLLAPSKGSSNPNNAAANIPTNQQTHLRERTEGVQVPEISVSAPVVEDDGGTKGTSCLISSLTNSITNQRRFQQEVGPEFTASAPAVKDDNKTRGALHAVNQLTTKLTNLQRFQEIREVGGISESNLSALVVKQDNGTKVVSQNILQEQRRELDQVLESSGSAPALNSSNKMKDVNHLYKGQLQTYTQKQNLNLPTYIPEREGPPHACRFRCKVVVGEQTFESQEFFSTLKEAEHAAAKIALASLVPNARQEVDCLIYKNLLQELAQRKSFLLPVYTTARSGAPHSPTFVSTVEVAGKVFGGHEAKTKKLAEMSAAKVAYISLKGGISSQTPALPLPSEQQEKPHEAFPAKSSVTSSLQESPLMRPMKARPDVPSKWVEVHDEEPLFPDLVCEPGNFSFPSEKKMNSSSMLETPTDKIRESSVDEIANKLIMGTANRSSASREHVVVRPWTPGMTLPLGVELVFRDDEWVAFRTPKP